MKDRRQIINLFFGLVVAVATSLALPLMVAGQEGNDIVLTINQVDDSSYPMVLLLASVTDRTGNPIDDLSQSDFTLYQAGNELPILSLTAVDESQQGIAIVLVVDTSGSMNQASPTGQSALNIAKEATNSFINNLDLTKDQVALISFNSDTILTQLFSSDIDTLQNSIDNLVANGETRLFDATNDAVELVSRLPSGRKAIILLTDGQDTESRLTIDDIISQTEDSSVPIYTIGLGSEIDPIPLERLAILTGGRYLNAPSLSDIDSNLNLIADQLRKQYAISFEPDILADDRRYPISLVVKNGNSTDEDVSSLKARPRQGTVQLQNLGEGEVISSPTVISPTIEMPGKISRVSYIVDSEVQEVKTKPAYDFNLDPPRYTGGKHTLVVRVLDHVGNQAEVSSEFEIITPPVVLKANIINPKDGDELVDPTPIVVEVEGDPKGVEKVEFLINDVLVETRENEPYEYLWDVSALEPGLYNISTIVQDTQGNQLEDGIQVRVDLPTVIEASITGVVQGQIINQSVPLAVSINDTVNPIDRVQFLDNGQVFAMKRNPPFEVAWVIDDVIEGQHLLTARIYDVQGNIWEDSVDVTVRHIPSGLPANFLLPVIVGISLIAVVGLMIIVVLARRRRNEYSYSEPYHSIPANRYPSYTENGPKDFTVDELTMEIIQPQVKKDHQEPSEKEVEPSKVEAEVDVSNKTINGRFELAAQSIWTDRPVTGRRNLGPAYLLGFQETTGEILEYPISENGASIGRSRDVDILLHDTKVSREHAEIRFKDGEFVFIDKQPTNPSYINGQVYSSPQVLKDGDELIIGVTKLIFRQND